MSTKAKKAKASLPTTPEELQAFMAGLKADPAADERAARLATELPGRDSEVMVVRSVRLPVATEQAVIAAAKAAGVSKTAWIRQAIETVLHMETDDGQTISRADALRALAALRSAPNRP